VKIPRQSVAKKAKAKAKAKAKKPATKRKSAAKRKKPAPPPNPVGRPKIELDIDQCKTLSAQGMTEQQIADAMQVSINTLRANKHRNAEFLTALTEGKAQGIASMTNAVFRSGIAGNHSAQRYYLNNRDPVNWKERVEHHVEGEIAIYGLDDDDRALAGLSSE
jgi:hypothetical protein